MYNEDVAKVQLFGGVAKGEMGYIVILSDSVRVLPADGQ